MADTPDPHAQKYDRQLRLWGAHGQKALEDAKICLLGVTPVGTETMKNLILPGVGSFCVVDEGNITARDLGNNFFVEEGDVGQPRAQVATKWIAELNPDVKSFIHEAKSPSAMIDENPEFFRGFDVVVVTDLDDVHLVKLSELCWEANVSVVVARSYGFLGHIRTQVPEHTIVETKPEFDSPDLRLGSPFPALLEHANGIDMASLNSAEHSHVAFPVILIKALQKWREENKKDLPGSNDEKEGFKKMVAAMSRSPHEENFKEAYRSARLAYMPVSISSDVKAILEDEKGKTVGKDTPTFWVLVHALRGFMEAEGKGMLSLPGPIPDMTADTAGYIKIQKVYSEEAKAHREAIRKRVDEALEAAGRKKEEVSDAELELFCKNAHTLKVIRYKKIKDEYEGNLDKSALEMDAFMNNNAPWYACLRAAYAFYTKKGTFPQPEDLKEFQGELARFLSSTSLPKDFVSDDQIKEMLRAGHAQLHTVGALIGGMASQEVIKVLTRQWVAMNNTHVFNGYASTSSTFAL